MFEEMIGELDGELRCVMEYKTICFLLEGFCYQSPYVMQMEIIALTERRILSANVEMRSLIKHGCLMRMIHCSLTKVLFI